MNNPYIFKVQQYSIHDGPGIRTTLFFQGCPLSCHWCHNPESQRALAQISEKDIKILVPALMKEIEKDLIFYDESGGGVTFSGGEPLGQPQLLFRLLDECRKQEIHTCVDTSGYADAEILLAAAKKTDLILYDVKLMDASAHAAYTGRDNRIILDNLKGLSRQGANVRLRFPLVPGHTDTLENIDWMIQFLSGQTMYRDIHVLPFHKAGEGKYNALNKKNHMEQVPVPSTETVDNVKQRFESKGFKVTIGG